MTVGDALKRIQDMKSTAETYYRDGRLKESKELKEKSESLRKEIEEFQATERKKQDESGWLNIDYSNPSEEVRSTAAKMGLDLQDPR